MKSVNALFTASQSSIKKPRERRCSTFSASVDCALISEFACCGDIYASAQLCFGSVYLERPFDQQLQSLAAVAAACYHRCKICCCVYCSCKYFRYCLFAVANFPASQRPAASQAYCGCLQSERS